MQVHLVDGTYELFRYHFALPSHVTAAGQEVGATRGVAGSMLGLLEDGATHVGIATDHVIESFRNELYAGYKDGSGIEPELKSQFPRLEELLGALGFVVWPMVRHEADDALGAAALIAQADERVERVYICTPDKDLGQCVGGKVFQMDRRKGLTFGVSEVTEKFGVGPESIADYLGLVGDSADGFPGLAGWGAKSAATVLARYGHIEDIPSNSDDWDVTVRGAAKLSATLNENLDEALLFRNSNVDELRWTGPRSDLNEIAERLDATALVARAEKLATVLS